MNEKIVFFQYYKLGDVYQFISVAVFIAVTILEGVRLYLGYLGNLAVKVCIIFRSNYVLENKSKFQRFKIQRIY